MSDQYYQLKTAHEELQKRHDELFAALTKKCMEASQLNIENSKLKNHLRLAIVTMKKAFDQKLCWKQDTSAVIKLIEDELDDSE